MIRQNDEYKKNVPTHAEEQEPTHIVSLGLEGIPRMVKNVDEGIFDYLSCVCRTG